MDFETNKPWHPENERNMHSRIVTLGPTSPIQLDLREVEHELAPEGTVALEVMHQEKRLSRCIVDCTERDEFFAIFREPVSLMLAAREEEPGIQACLVACIPIEERPNMESADEPWKQSALPFEDAEATPSDTRENGVLVKLIPLGNIVRMQADRKSPDSLQEEALDLFGAVLSGKTGDVIDRILAHLGV